MAVQILLSQSGAPAGTAGRARQDFVTGLAVVAQAVGGPFTQYRWTIIDKPPDIVAGVNSNAALSAPAASSTNITPIDQPGTYLIELAVNSGLGLGATEEDVTRITFYAGLTGDPTLGAINSNPAQLPQRWPAFGERKEHNVVDALSPAGNPTGWARTMLAWNAFFRSLTGSSSTVTFAQVQTAMAAATGAIDVNNQALEDVKWVKFITSEVAILKGTSLRMGTNGNDTQLKGEGSAGKLQLQGGVGTTKVEITESGGVNLLSNQIHGGSAGTVATDFVIKSQLDGILTSSNPAALGTALAPGSSSSVPHLDHVHTLPESVLRSVLATITAHVSLPFGFTISGSDFLALGTGALPSNGTIRMANNLQYTQVKADGVTTVSMVHLDTSSNAFFGADTIGTVQVRGTNSVVLRAGSTTIISAEPTRLLVNLPIDLASGVLRFTALASPPGTPTAGGVYLYALASDKKLYFKDDTGSITGPLT